MLGKTHKAPGAKGGPKQAGNKPHGSIARGKGRPPIVKTPAKR